MDTGTLQPYKDAVSSANNDVASQTSAAPTLLNQLKSNLTSIFAKDNPFIAERGTALQNYLNAPSQSRVDTMPGNLPEVEGSHLNLSPTQQDAITTARRSSALVPLLGLNQLVTGLYGNIPGMVQGAGDIYNAQIQAAQQRAQGASQSLAQAFAEMQAKQAADQWQQQFAESQRQFNTTQRNKVGAAATPNLFSALAAMQGLGGESIPASGGGSATPSRPPLESFYTPDQQQNSGPNVMGDFLSGLGIAGHNALGWLGNNISWPKG